VCKLLPPISFEYIFLGVIGSFSDFHFFFHSIFFCTHLSLFQTHTQTHNLTLTHSYSHTHMYSQAKYFLSLAHIQNTHSYTLSNTILSIFFTHTHTHTHTKRERERLAKKLNDFEKFLL